MDDSWPPSKCLQSDFQPHHLPRISLKDWNTFCAPIIDLEIWKGHVIVQWWQYILYCLSFKVLQGCSAQALSLKLMVICMWRVIKQGGAVRLMNEGEMIFAINKWCQQTMCKLPRTYLSNIMMFQFGELCTLPSKIIFLYFILLSKVGDNLTLPNQPITA